MKRVSTIMSLREIDEAAQQLEGIEGLVVSQDYYDPLLDPVERAENLELAAYAEDMAQAMEALSLLQEQGFDAQLEELPDIDWVSQSQAGLPPVQAGPWRLHGSHDAPLIGRRRWQLRIDANTAFGTGHHETTRGCLLAMERLRRKRALGRVMDVGTGTGVLALAAARAGARAVVASDIDPEASRRTILNAQQNGVCARQVSASAVGRTSASTQAFLRITTAAGSSAPAIRSAGPYDLVFANILAGPLKSLAGDLASLLAPGGYLILAGLILPQQQGIESRYRQQGLQLDDRLVLGDWPTLVFRRSWGKSSRG